MDEKLCPSYYLKKQNYNVEYYLIINMIGIFFFTVCPSTIRKDSTLSICCTQIKLWSTISLGELREVKIKRKCFNHSKIILSGIVMLIYSLVYGA